jgi:hypothetical protein
MQKLEFSQKSLTKILESHDENMEDSNFCRSKFILNKNMKPKSYRNSKDIVDYLNGYGTKSNQTLRKSSITTNEIETVIQQKDQKILSLKEKIKKLKNNLSN